MRLRAIALFIIAALSACSGPRFAPSAPDAVSPQAFFDSAVPGATATQHVYWTLYASSKYPQLQISRVPLAAKSKVTDIAASSRNDLLYSAGLAVDSAKRIWVLSFGKSGGSPTSAVVFKVPITGKSAPLYKLVLSGTKGADAMAFDPSGNLWVASPGNSSVLEYKGPFKKSGTLKPAKTLTATGVTDYGIAVDKHADVYVSDNKSTGTGSIGVLKPPYDLKDIYFLDGLNAPGGLAFDKQGNLYASTNGSSPAIVRYNSDDLQSGDDPSIVDPTGLPAQSYGSAFAFTSKGDLYVANCGNSSSAGIDVYPTSTQQFSANLAPSLLFENTEITAAGCAWGIAIR